MPVQMRLSQSDNRKYSPDRDLAYCMPHLLHRAVSGLDLDKQEDWVKEYVKEHNLDDEALSNAAVVLAEYCNKTLLDPHYKHPFEALDAVGFFTLPTPIRIIVCAKIGQVMLSAFFTSLRDVVNGPEELPATLKDIAVTAQELNDRIVAKHSNWFKRSLCSIFNYLMSWL